MMKNKGVDLRSDIQLRDIQVRAVEKVLDDVHMGKKRLIMSLTLGFGKSLVLLEIMNRLVEEGHTVLLLSSRMDTLNNYLSHVNEVGDYDGPYRIDTIDGYIKEDLKNIDYDFIIFDTLSDFSSERFVTTFERHINASVILADSVPRDLKVYDWFGQSFEISYEYTIKNGVDDSSYVPVYMHLPFEEPKRLLPKDQMFQILSHLENELVGQNNRTTVILTSTTEEATELRYELKAINGFFNNANILVASTSNSISGPYSIKDSIETSNLINGDIILIGTLNMLWQFSLESCRKLFILCDIEDFTVMNQLLAKCMGHSPGKRQLDIYDYSQTFYRYIQVNQKDYGFIQANDEISDFTIDENAILMLTNRNPGMLNDSVEHRDLLSMNREAKVFKHLIKQEDNTPLAIGIFGEWGSGKSFFLRTIQEELKAEKETVFQIKFNAWHYSDTNLILSLSNHIFERLNMEVIKKTDAKTEVIKEHVDQLETQKKSLVDFKDENDKKIETLEGEYETQRNELLDASYDKLIAGTDNPLINNAISLFKLKKDAKEYYTKAKTIRGRLKLFFGMDQNRTNIMMLLPIIILLLGPWLLDLLKLLTIDSNIKSVIRIVQLLGIALSSPVLHKAVTNVAKVINELDEFSEKQEALIKKQIGIEGLKKKSTKLQGDINGIDAEIAQAKTGDYITYLLGERIHNRNYHEHLGIIHHLRKDLELLSDYLLDENNSTKINKVVLYIDDLDRCPADKVAQVLEAVHLLLSFKVFVVFVAADMKWISKCLYMNHGDKKMLTKATKESLLFAYDYMEKIFQLTYKPQALHGETSVKFITGLCTDLVAKKEVKRQVIEETRKEIDEITEIIEEKSVFEQPFEQPRVQTTPVTDQSIAVDIKLDEEEIKRLKEILALVNSTPRRLKRFMNTYQMIRASYDTSRTTYEIMILLVMIIYYPDEQNFFVDNLSQSLKLSDYIYLVNEKEEKHDFLEAIVKSEFAKEMDQLELLRWLPVVNRYSFFPCEE